VLRIASFLAVLCFASIASAQDVGSPPADDIRHGWFETRFGGAGFSTVDDGQMRFGPSVQAAVGTGFRWLDLGVTGRYESMPTNNGRLTLWGFGPELGLRKRLAPGATFRLAFAPQYMFAVGHDDHARYGADAMAQLLFNVDDSTSRFLRAGLGLRAGRWTSVDSRDPAGWSVGVDIILRSFW
jgi:hypothetical protein